MARGLHTILRPVMSGLIIGLAVATLISQPLETFTFWGAQSVKLNWMSLWPLLSALASIGGLAAAFAINARGLMGLCVVASLIHIGHFYYTLGTSLLLKSITMIALGALFLGLARVLSAKGQKP